MRISIIAAAVGATLVLGACSTNVVNHQQTNTEQVIYLSGITNDPKLSMHLSSRKLVEETLASNKYALTTFRAGTYGPSSLIRVCSHLSSQEMHRPIRIPISKRLKRAVNFAPRLLA